MSDLGKFQNNPAWRDKLLEYLIKDRSPHKKPTQAKVMEEEHDSRYSLDITCDLKICPAKPAIDLAADIHKDFVDKPDSIEIENDSGDSFVQNEVNDTFSAIERMCDKSGSDPDSTLFQYLHSDDKEQVIHLAKERRDISNISKGFPEDTFAAMERMCDKSESDPNSTLFHYLNSEDKEKVINSSKDRMELTENDKEIESLNRLMAGIITHEQLDMESPLKGVEQTLLEDVEAPSRFWDNDSSLSQDALLSCSGAKKTSPVKMVGLLRPSTIIEANEADASTNASSTNVSSLVSSFQTAKGLKTDISMSSCYETATDSSLGGAEEAVSVDGLFYAAIRQAKPLARSEYEVQSGGPINAEETCDMENTIIELSSSDEDDDCKIREAAATSIKSENVSTQLEEQEADEDKENSRSINLNNTMEEMEYMMKKGLEYIAAGALSAPPKVSALGPHSPKTADSARVLFKAPAPLKIAAPKSPKTVSPAITPNASPKKLIKQNTFVVSPQSKLKSPLISQQKKMTPSSSRMDRFGLKMEQPKRKFFTDTAQSTRQPASAIPLRHQLKLKPTTYDHIVSPIRTYTHKSGTAPLMSQFHKTGNEFSSAVMTELEKESRHHDHLMMKPRNAGDNVNVLNKLEIDGIDRTARRLPKKAYIASKIKHVVDERTPLPMPNVPKIQKYLNSAVEPTVLRHDGKVKLPGGGTGTPASHIPRPSNKSLADLSLASGDISLYTMKDAQKF